MKSEEEIIGSGTGETIGVGISGETKGVVGLIEISGFLTRISGTILEEGKAGAIGGGGTEDDAIEGAAGLFGITDFLAGGKGRA